MFDSDVILLILVIIGGAMAFTFLGNDGDEKTSSAQKDTNAETPPVQSDRGGGNSTGNWSRFFWLLSLLSSIIAVIGLAVGLNESESAVQEASVGAIAVAIAVIPYCAARAVSELGAK